eukprot:6213986-Alexandrium_andersonii.AAC.1
MPASQPPESPTPSVARPRVTGEEVEEQWDLRRRLWAPAKRRLNSPILSHVSTPDDDDDDDEEEEEEAEEDGGDDDDDDDDGDDHGDVDVDGDGDGD